MSVRLPANVPPSSTMDLAVARGAAVLRTFAVLYSLIFIVLWHSWFFDRPVRVVVPLLYLLWGGVFVGLAVRRGLRGRLIAADVVLALALAVVSAHLVPPDTVGDGANWAYMDIGAATMVAPWGLAGWLGSLVALVLAGSYAVSAHLVGPAGPQPGAPSKSLVLLLVLTAMWSYAVRTLRRQARLADDRLARANEAQRAADVERARARDRRERDRLVHDTVLNTLTGIAWGGVGNDVGAAHRRCDRDVTVLAALVASTDGRSADLGERLRAVAAEMPDVGLRVEVDLTGGRTGSVGTGWDGAAAGGQPVESAAGQVPAMRQPEGPEGTEEPDLPPEVVLALAAATREALANVHRHAGTDCAYVTLRRSRRGVRVFVRDEGSGFDPGTVGAGRLGIARSISGRMRDVGGTAEITSMRGRGTTVALGWEAPAAAEVRS